MRTQPVERFVPGLARQGSGISVSLKVVDREYGRLEASILADARNRYSDVRIPAAPIACELASVRVPRRPGYVGLALADHRIFESIRAIFPILNGWLFGEPASSRAELPGIVQHCVGGPEEARYDLAQSVLLLNYCGELPDSLLIDAALYGVPCIGAAWTQMQRFFWPELAVEDECAAVAAARELLTNAARLRGLVASARTLCIQTYAPSEEQSAQSWRRLHAEQTRGTVLAAR